MNTTDARAPFFVMAHHRSGSNFLNDLLQEHPRIECINEPLSMHTRFFIDCDLAPWSSDEYDPLRLHPSFEGHGTLREFLRDLKRFLLSSTRHRVMGFKETCLFGKLEWLKIFMPSLKIVFLQRDPHAIVSSVLHSGLTSLWKYEQLVPPAFQRLFPGYESRVEPADGAARSAELAVMSVALRYKLARESLSLFDHMVMDLDSFTQDPERALKLVTGFLGLEPHEQQLEFLSRRQSLSRGGTFSSFRSNDDVHVAWRSRLGATQVDAIEAVLQFVRKPV